VIAPYNAQVKKIREALNKIKAEKVKVGSVEEFQGQERRVMLISTVRSNLEYVETDITHTLGFVANSRRFNGQIHFSRFLIFSNEITVAMTRAQALLIVIGNPLVLSLDGLWRSFLNYVYNHGGWTGLPLPDWDTSKEIDGPTLVQTRAAQATAETQELLQRITEIVENRNADEDMDDLSDPAYQQEERPRRDEGE
jgi:helicase MOV-10